MEAVPVAYARNGDVHLAYQVVGDGDRTIFHRWSGFVPIEMAWEYPPFAGFLDRLAGLGRLVLTDRRGVGLSDPVDATTAGTTTELAADMAAVLDAVAAREVVAVADGFPCAPLIELAVTRPDLVGQLVLLHPIVRTFSAPDFPYGLDPDVAQELGRQLVEDGADAPVGILGPAIIADHELRAFLDRAGRLGASPRSAMALYGAYGEYDVRQLVGAITQPTLVIQRRDTTAMPSQWPFIADSLPSARFVELPGADYLPYVGDSEAIVAEIEEFVTGVRGAAAAQRVLVAVLFTDLVASTERAAAVGDTEWRRLLDRHDRLADEAIGRFGGRQVKETGDGVLAVFSTATGAIGCARALRAGLEPLGLESRAAIHVGEVEQRGSDVSGLGVNLAARLLELATGGQILVSAAVPPAVTGSGLAFEARGEHELRGVPGRWAVLSVD